MHSQIPVYSGHVPKFTASTRNVSFTSHIYCRFSVENFGMQSESPFGPFRNIQWGVRSIRQCCHQWSSRITEVQNSYNVWRLVTVDISSQKFGSTALSDIIRAPRICIIDALTYASNARRLVARFAECSSAARVVTRWSIASKKQRARHRHRSPATSLTAPQAPRTRSTTKTLNLERERLSARNCQRTSSIAVGVRGSVPLNTTESSLLYAIHDSSDVSYTFPRYIVTCPREVYVFGISHSSAGMQVWLRYALIKAGSLSKCICR